MILGMKTFLKCLFSPRLYKVYGEGQMDSMYKPLNAENWGENIIGTANVMFNITLYTSPFVCFYMYKISSFTYEDCMFATKILGCFGCFLALSFLMRAYGRAANPKYVKFLKDLETFKNQGHETHTENVRKYDFDFASWPVSYEVTFKSNSSRLFTNPFKATANVDLPFYQRTTIQVLAYIATHTFAIRLIYPGSLSLIHHLLWQPLFLGRNHLVQHWSGQRAKIRTADGNFIDTMFVDKRLDESNGSTLVVCCEGNSGFYEVGIMTSPIKIGYSALGWNHPGFAGSTGLPYPSQEHNAIDAVMQYAINKLGFKPENIIMYGWSIGGYSATWASTKYPVKGLILDATFDDLLPLAQNQMPASWSLLVKEVIRTHVDLHVAAALQQYSGPVHLVRRTEDEIICLKPGDHATNRGNYLLMEIVRQRHPDLFVDHFKPLLRYANMLDHKRPSMEIVDSEEERRILKTVRQYMSDYRSTHCTPLPEDFFGECVNRILTK